MAAETLYDAVQGNDLPKIREAVLHGLNIYAVKSYYPPILWLAFSYGNEPIIHYLMDFYERDFKTLDTYFLTKNVTNYFWRKEIILIAYGTEHIKYVRDRVGQMVVTEPEKMLADEKKGLVMLLKTSNTSEADVLWVTPQTKGDDIKIIDVIEHIHSDGCIVQNDELLWQWHCDQTLCLTHIRNMPEVFLRVVDLFYSHRDVSNVDYLEYLFYLANFTENSVDTFLNLSRKLGKFDIHDVFLANTDCLLDRLATAGIFYIFDYFINIAAEVKMKELNLRKDETLTSIIGTKNEVGRNYIETAVLFGRKQFGIDCLRYRPNLFATDFSSTTFYQLMSVDRKIVGDLVFENIDVILEKGFGKDVVTELFLKNCLEVLVKLYEKYPIFKILLVKDYEAVIQCFGMAIYSCTDVTDKSLAYLINVHKDDLTTDVVVRLIHFTLLKPKVLQLLLSFDVSAPDNLYKDLMFRTYFGSTIMNQDIQSYTVLLGHFRDNSELLKDILDDNKDNLLGITLWDEQYGQLRGQEELDAATQKRTGIKWKMENEMHNHFCYLIDVGVDIHHINLFGENLLHIAVKRNNVFIFNKLLELGVNPNVASSNGTKPVHFVNSLEMFDALMHKLPKGAINETIDNADGVLHSFLKNSQFQRTKEHLLLEKLINVGVDIHQPGENGNVPLHLVRNVELAKVLIAHGANVNAKNDDGATPAFMNHHYTSDRFDYELFTYFICYEETDLLVTMKNGVSLLSYLVALPNDAVQKVLLAFATNPDRLDQLFRMHCNTFDCFNCPLLYNASVLTNNDYCLFRMLNLEQLKDVENERTHAGLGCLPWLIARGALYTIRKTKDAIRIEDFTRTHPEYNYSSNLDIILFLLNAGAEPDVKSPNGNTTLDYVRYLPAQEYIPIMVALIKAGADYRHLDMDNEAPLMNTIFKCLYEFDG